jgi:hypothetical protein
MNHEREHWISQRAHELWLEAGSPDGSDQEHWFQAASERDKWEAEIAGMDGHELTLAISD